jgi:hypothetical protein
VSHFVQSGKVYWNVDRIPTNGGNFVINTDIKEDISGKIAKKFPLKFKMQTGP